MFYFGQGDVLAFHYFVALGIGEYEGVRSVTIVAWVRVMARNVITANCHLVIANCFVINGRQRFCADGFFQTTGFWRTTNCASYVVVNEVFDFAFGSAN